MYVPTHFAETDRDTLHAFVERHGFGALVSEVNGEPFATHLPFLLDRHAGPHGTLVGHVARTNPHWRSLAGRTALAVFAGPHAYVSPTWYEAANTVPTWNYTAVHATGPVAVVEDQAELLDIVDRTTAVYEAAMPQPWVLDRSAATVGKLLDHIVGFRLRIDRLEGKWKLNQNRPADQRRKVMRALAERGEDDVAALMAVTLGEDVGPPRLGLLPVPGRFAVCKLPVGAAVPGWATAGDLFAVVRTADEVSVVCGQELVPAGVTHEPGWRAVRVAGAMPFTQVGVLAALTVPLARAGVGVFAVSTFDTDYLLVKQDDYARGVAALRAAGHRLEGEP